MRLAADSTDTASPALRRCAQCGYDLRALAHPRCPECGTPFNPQRPPAANVPWLNRPPGQSAIWAYCATVCIALFHPSRIAREVSLTVYVDRERAAAFSRITIIIVTVSLAIMPSLLLSWRAALMTAIFTIAATLLFFWCERQWNTAARTVLPDPAAHLRFERLEHLSKAALAFAPIIPVGVGLARLSDTILPAIVPPIIVLGAWYCSTIYYQWRGGRTGGDALVVYALLVPVFWVISAMVAVFAGFVLVILLAILT